MSITKLFNDCDGEKSMECFPTIEKKICFRFLYNGTCEFTIDLDIETAEALMDEIHLSLSQFEGGEECHL